MPIKKHNRYLSSRFISSPKITKSIDEDYKSKVNVLISWSDKSKRECTVEVRSDEPYLKKDTRCQKVHTQLRELIPPKEVSTQFKTTEV